MMPAEITKTNTLENDLLVDDWMFQYRAGGAPAAALCSGIPGMQGCHEDRYLRGRDIRVFPGVIGPDPLVEFC